MSITIEPEPLSLKRLMGIALLSVALVLSISLATNKRIEVERPQLAVELRPLESKVEASSIEEVIPALAPEKPAEPVQEVKQPEVVVTPPEPVKPVTEPVVVAKPIVKKVHPKPVGDAKAFIYQKESGNNPHSVNKKSGACGLGQALPCSKMPCAMGDYACQDKFFTAYMQNRYGSWENARSFWLKNKWW
jgi:outer membrane biosynthesis protein TonB